MNTIKFNKTSNILINSGIISLYLYLLEFREKNKYYFKITLENDFLEIYSENLKELLRDVYYFMAKELYDTSTSEQLKNFTNAYYISQTNTFVKFPRMKTYGLAELITNDKRGTTINPKNTTTRKKLEKENKALLKKIENFFEKEGIKLQKQIYFNEPYTKITRLELDDKFFIEGEKICSVTGEKFQKLETLQNTSPFISGLVNFNSYFAEDAKPHVSWKIKYIVHFAPKLSFYRYSGTNAELLYIYFFNSTSLKNLLALYEINKSLYKSENELKENNYKNNYNLFFKNELFTEQYENLFAIIYTFYILFLKTQIIEQEKIYREVDIFANSKFERIPISLITFSAKKFSETKRPDSYEEINNFKFILKIIHILETQGIKFNSVLYSLKIISPTLNNKGNTLRLERMLRDKILHKFIKGKSIIREIELLFFKSFQYLFDKNYKRKHNYNMLTSFVKYYEQIINFGGNKSMNTNLQEKAINLGTSIGKGILLFENEASTLEKQRENIRKARKYLIGLRKAGNFTKFMDTLIRIQEKFHLSISKELLQQINNENYSYLQKFVVISALNQLNTVMSRTLKDNNVEQKEEEKNATE